MAETEAKVFIFGPWVKTTEDGKVEATEEFKTVGSWLNDENAVTTDELGRLLRVELKAEKEYRNLVAREINLIRNDLLDKANAVIPDLMNPGKTVVEAYNNGIKMGEHQAYVFVAQALSDMIDKIHIMKVVTDD